MSSPTSEELTWRRRIEDKIDKLFQVTSQIQIDCARKSGCYDQPEPIRDDGLSGREKFLLGLMGCAMTIIGILAGIAFGS